MLNGKYYTPAGAYIADFLLPQEIVLSALSPGGWAMATWSSAVTPPYLGLAEAPGNSRVEIYDAAGALVFRGRVESPGYQIGPGSGTVLMTAHGYAASLSDRFYTYDRSFLAGETASHMMTAVRNELCPDLSRSDRLIRPTSRGIVAATGSWRSKRPSEIFRQISQIGDSSDNPLLWHVWEGQGDSTGKAELEIIPRPTTPSYYVAVAEGTTLGIEMPLSEMYNEIEVAWGSVPYYETVDDRESQAQPPVGYGLTRMYQFSASQINSPADARNIGNALLTRLSRVRAHGSAITIPRGTLVQDAAGAVIPPERVRCGRMIEIADLRQGATSVAQYRFVIAASQYRDATGVLTLTPESIDATVAVVSRLGQPV